jgi:hypothetical protein
MAKKKRTYRRKKMGAFNPNGLIVKAAAVAAGYFLGDTINAQVDKILPASMTAATATGMTSYLPAAAEVGIGGLLLLSKKKPSIIKTAIGGVLAGAGLRRGLKKAGVVTGYQSVEVIGGYNQVPVMGNVPPQLSGVPPQLSGYMTSRVNGFKTSRVVGGCDNGSGLMSSGSGYMN